VDRGARVALQDLVANGPGHGIKILAFGTLVRRLAEFCRTVGHPWGDLRVDDGGVQNLRLLADGRV